jgi:hypothetical protein
MDYLEHFLASGNSLKKTPRLVLVGANPTHPGEGLMGAVLLFEYRVLGFGTRIFVPEDLSGRRILIAPPDERMQVARLAADALMRNGALLVMQCWGIPAPETKSMTPDPSPPGRRRWMYAERTRMFTSHLVLENTMDATLARIGQKTRFNLRYYRRRAEAKLGCAFVADIQINRQELQAFNRRCTYAVRDDQAAWRHDAFFGVPGMFLHGIRESNGDWLSIIGGRRYRDVVEIDWQMNRSDLPAYSLSTVMRSYFMEHEIARGTRKMYIEGGTPHAMRHHFAIEMARDLVVLRHGWILSPLRRVAGKLRSRPNFFMQVMVEKRMKWTPWFNGQ